MKLKSMTSIIAKSVTVLAACAALNASAGTMAPKAPLPPVEPEPSALFDSIGADLSAAFDSRYYFRGLWFADNIVSTFLNLSVPLVGGSAEDGAGSITWGLGGGYISTVETPFGNPKSNTAFDYSEIDLYTSLSYDAGWATFGVQYQYYFYPDSYAGSFNGVSNGNLDPEFGIRGAGEIGVTMAVPIGAANLYFGYYYDMQIGGSYFQAAADYTIAVNDWLSIVPAAQIGYGIDYYTGNNNAFTRSAVTAFNGGPLGPTSGLTHVLLSVSTPIQLTKSATFTPYVAWNNGNRLRAQINAQQEEFFWGAKLSVSF